MKKKVLSLFLAIAMLISLMPTALAAEPCLKADKNTLYAGEDITVTYTMHNTVAEVADISIKIGFDNTKLRVKSVTPATIPNASSMHSNPSEADAAGAFSATFNEPSGDPIGTVTANTVLLTAVLTAKEDITSGELSFSVQVASIANVAGESLVTQAGFDTAEELKVTVPKAPITTAKALVDAPVKDATLDTTVDTGSATTYDASVEWYEGSTATGTAVTGSAKANQIYTAKFTLTPKTAEGENFASTVTVTGSYEGSASPNSDGKLVFTKTFDATADKNALQGTVSIAGTAKYNEILTAQTSSLDYNSEGSGTLSYQWYRGDTAISGATSSTYTLVAADVGQTIKVQVKNSNNSGSVTSAATAAVAKADGPAAPSGLVEVSKTDTTITVTQNSAWEYSKDSGSTWQTSNTFTGLTPNTAYNQIVARVKETATHKASAACSAISVTTTKATADSTLKNTLKNAVTAYNAPYDGAAHDAFTVGSLPSGWSAQYADSESGSYSTTMPKVTNVSDSKTLWVKFSNSSYSDFVTSYSVSVTAKNISGATITLNDAPTYNGSEQTITINKVEVGSTALTTGDYDITSGNKATNVENTTLKITGKGNYTGTASTTWSLQKATPVESDFSITTPTAKDYTGSPITVPAPTSSKNGIGTRTVKYADSTTAPTNAGTYAVTFDVAEGQNYTAATGLSIGTLTINKVDYNGTNTASATVRSGQVNTDVTLTLPALPAGASYGTVSASGDLIDGTPTVSGTTLTYSTTSQTDGTTATITIGVTGATNYNDYSVTVTVTAKDKNPAEVTLDTVPTSKTYGDTNFTVTASATHTEAGGTWTWTSSNESVLKVTGTSTTGTVQVVGQGSATITAKYESANYLGEATSASITVNKKNVTITGLSASSKEYDGNTTATVNGTAVVSGQVGSDAVTVTAGTAAFANKTVGNNKTVTFSGYSLSGAAAGNYNLTAQPNSVTANITAKPVTVTVTATDRNYVSGNRNVVLVAGSVTGAIGGDTVNVDVSGATGTLENEDAGTGKAVAVTGVALSGADAGNYNLTAQPTGVTVTINKKNYDGSITGNKNVHTNQAQTGVTFDMSEKFGVIKGAAVKSASEGTDSDNLIDNVSVDGNVVKFDVASIADAGKTATINVVISCTNFNDITAVLTVKTVDKDEAGVTISGVPAEAKTYGDADLTLTASAATPGANGTWTWETNDSSVLQLTPNGNKVTVKLLKAGSATVTAKYESDTTIGQLTTANIRVNKATITVTAKDQSIYVNGTAPDLTSPVKDTHYTVTGLASGDTLGGTIAMKYQKDGSDAAPDVTKTGTYDIVISGATAPAGGNYNDVIFAKGTLTIASRPSSGGGGVSTYSITAEPTEHGTISVSPKNASKGTTVTVTVKPDEGYELDALTVTNGSGKAVTVTEKEGKYTFTMPASKVSVKATFKEAEKPVTMPFADVKSGDWFYEDVQYVYSKGMMVGTKEDQFTPHATTTRGMIITILYRLEGEPTVSGLNAFDDVAEGEWYSAAVKWAVKNEIVGGYGNGKFGPEDVITREQMAVILYRYAAFKGQDMTKVADLSKFTDNGEISGYAVPSLGWANAEGLVSGKGSGILDPLGSATRAEAAAILHRFCENMVK